METKFTKGEWIYNGATDIKVATEYLNEKGEIKNGFTHIANVSHLMEDSERKANAKLIAAAPEMLSLLIAINETITSGVQIYEGDTIQQNIVKAIERATK